MLFERYLIERTILDFLSCVTMEKLPGSCKKIYYTFTFHL